MNERYLYIIAGCNGAGKTTASYTILPEIIKCKEFVNADEIARGLSPFQPETVALEAGRIMIARVDELLNENKSFGLETTLSTRIYLNKIQRAKEQGYIVTLLFFGLNNPELAKERVKIRVKEGGHHIPEDVIERRFYKGITYLFDLYIPIVDNVMIFDNSFGKPKLIAQKLNNENLQIIDSKKFNWLKKYYEQKR